MDGCLPDFKGPLVANWEIFAQALFHPVVNAIKFNKRGGKIIITLSAKQLDDKLFLVCCIRDEGTGISPEDIKSLFQAF